MSESVPRKEKSYARSCEIHFKHAWAHTFHPKGCLKVTVVSAAAVSPAVTDRDCTEAVQFLALKTHPKIEGDRLEQIVQELAVDAGHIITKSPFHEFVEPCELLIPPNMRSELLGMLHQAISAAEKRGCGKFRTTAIAAWYVFLIGTIVLRIRFGDLLRGQ